MDDQRRMAPHFLPGMAGMAGMTAKREAKVGNLKLDLPVDEDDYLMPSPQPTQTNGGYMDLIGDAKLGGKCFASQYWPVLGVVALLW
jgi:hypothetical protein